MATSSLLNPRPSAAVQPSTERKAMKPVIRYQSQLLFRKSYKPARFKPSLRLKPMVFRPPRMAPTKESI
jgi:hypothetical protein